MPYVTPPAAVPGQPADVYLDWNIMRDSVEALAKPALAILTASAAQTIPNTTWTTVLFPVEVVDTAAGHSTSSNTGRFTVRAGWAGYYQFPGCVSFDPNANGARYCRVRKNGGTVVLRGQGGPSAGGSLTTEVVMTAEAVYLAVDDYVELQVYQSSGGSLNTAITDSVTPRWTVRWIGA